MEIPKKLIDFLNENKASYEILHHPEAFTAQTIAAAEHIKARRHAQEDYIVFEAGTQTDAIKLSYRDYERVAKPQVEDFAIKLHPIKQT